jgi:outer membrane protein
MKKLAFCLIFLFCLLLTPALAKELRIGVVDMEDIINKSADYKRIESSLQRKSEELGRPLQQREQELGRQVAEFQKQAQAGIIKDDALKRKETEFQQKIPGDSEIPGPGPTQLPGCLPAGNEAPGG